ncbi:hypothetical protein D9M70_528410 [compost metagenome]
MFVHVFGSSHEEVGAPADALCDERRIAQFAKSDRHVDVFGNEIHEHVCDQQVDLDLGVFLQETRQEIKERRLPESHGDCDAQKPFGFSLRFAQDPFRVVKLLQRFAALRVVSAPLKREVQFARRPLQQSDAQLLLKGRHFAANR